LFVGLFMRVIAGKAKGRRLASVPGDTTRPITDRTKEALFDILGGRVEDARMLDLFAGTGSVGIEALSRGAREVWFVERERRAVQAIKSNLELTGLAQQARVVRQDVFRFIQQVAGREQFDIIYVAPPQYRELWAKTLKDLDEAGLLNPMGIVIAQIYPKEFEELELATLSLVDRRKYGSTLLCFYRPIEGSSS
jgi:16S rRNA (guanine966-N2)-methyltransferase